MTGDFSSSINVCIKEQSYDKLKMMNFEFKECGKQYLSFIFFVLFFIIMTMMVLNMFIAVVLEGFSESMKDSLRCVNSDI
mmetsp:Transcript_18943/g.15496  ORF Transcript_18943/g.15496 Transcript_18943/m.15496 type:complete len:80 (-) Transcript_18943:368-607(-)